MKFKFCPYCGSSLAAKEIDGVTRLSCSSKSCNYIFWDNPTPVIAAIVEHNDKVLLIRNKGWPEDMFGLVTGFLEKNETPEKGILREVKEELGIDGEIVSLVGIYSFFEMNQLILAYHVVAHGEITIGEELADIKAIPPENLKPRPFGTGFALQDWLEKRRDTQ
jgi:NAD+ diphosphatase